jgi:hypothetical protein
MMFESSIKTENAVYCKRNKYFLNCNATAGALAQARLSAWAAMPLLAPLRKPA